MSPSSEDKRELDALLSPTIDAELAFWKHLIFHPDMPHEKRHENTSNNQPANSQSSQLQIPPQVPPELYNHFIHTLLSTQGAPPHPPYSTHPTHPPHPPTYPYPIHPSQGPPTYNYPWPPPILPANTTSPPTFYPPIPHVPPPQIAGSSQFVPSPIASTAPNAQDQDIGEDATSTAEDKRRRNTAASARFRAKKKVKALNLERTVADLTGRTEELEREATDLRRENTWLKDIVVLKGRNLAALNVASQAAGPSNQRGQDDKDDDNDADAESELESPAKGRGKGKDK